MKIRNLLTLISLAMLIIATGCSTSGEAEADEQTQEQAAEQTGTQQQDDGQEDMQADDKMADKQQMMQQMMQQTCPMQVEGTSRQITEMDGAVAMDFTTTGDVDELRRRVQKMAQMHQKHHADGGMMHGEQGQMHDGHMHDGDRQHGQMHGEMTEEQRQMRQQMMQMMADVTVETEEIEGGMRMKFTPEDPAMVGQLHEMMHKHVQMMEEKGHCPMMSTMMESGMKKQAQEQDSE